MEDVLPERPHSWAACETFCKTVKGENIITRDHLKTIYVNDFTVEISTGLGPMFGNRLYGITVVDSGKHRHDLSRCVGSTDELRAYIKNLEEH